MSLVSKGFLYKDQIEELFIVMVYCMYPQHITLSTFSLISLFFNYNRLFKCKMYSLFDCVKSDVHNGWLFFSALLAMVSADVAVWHYEAYNRLILYSLVGMGILCDHFVSVLPPCCISVHSGLLGIYGYASLILAVITVIACGRGSK